MVTSESTDNMDDVSNKLNDLELVEVAIGTLTIHCPQAKVGLRCTSDWAAVIVDSLLPVTSDNVDSLLTTGLASWVTSELWWMFRGSSALPDR